MTETSREFHIGDLITVVDGHLVSPEHMGGVYNVVDFVTGQPHMTHQLPRASREVTPWLLEQHPWLAEIAVPDGLDGQAGVDAWLAPIVEQYGERHAVEPMPAGAYVGREAMAELVEMVGRDRVIPVVVDTEAEQWAP